MNNIVEVSLTQVQDFKFEGRNNLEKTVIIDGSKTIGGTEDGLRPMELILIGFAGCSSFDVVSILKKSRQKLKNLKVTVEGKRADTIPAVFEEIKIHFTASGEVSYDKLKQAVELSIGKYCSVAAMLSKTAKILSTYSVID